MRYLALTSIAVLAFSGAAMAQSLGPSTGQTNGVAGTPTTTETHGVQSSNGSGTGTTGAIKSGVGMTETVPSTTPRSTAQTPGVAPKGPHGSDTEGGSASGGMSK